MKNPFAPLCFGLRFCILSLAALLLAGCPHFTFHVDPGHYSSSETNSESITKKSDGKTTITTKSTTISSDGTTTTTTVTVVDSGNSTSDRLTGSGKSATENRDTGPFSRIQVDGSAKVEVEIGNTTAVALTFDDNLLPAIETKVEGDTLHIRPIKSYGNSLGLTVKITTPSLDGVTVSGACDLHASGLDAKEFALNISGTGRTRLEGKADALKVRLSGAGDIEANELIAKNVTLNISGTGNANVCAPQSLDASVSGAGNVRYSGHPTQVQKSVSGVGAIKED